MKLLKKILCGILSATMLITSAAIPVMADEDIKVILDGKALSFDVPPQIINDRTMVPLRAIFEALGASVDWNQETKTVTSTKDNTTIKLTIDSNTMSVNNKSVTLDTPACVVNDRTLVPVRAISEAYNTKVDWNGDTKTVIISSNTNINSQSTTELPKATEIPQKTQSYQSQNGSFELNHEYGPMTINRNYSTGKHWITNNISSLVFTKCEKTSIGQYKVFCSMQGIADGSQADVKVYFYDSNNRVLSEEWFYHDVTPNVEYNVLIEKFVAKDVIDNAARIEFYSYMGEKAVMENQSVVTDNEDSFNNTDDNKNNVSNNDLLSGYDKLKNELINKGTYKDGSYSAISTYESLTYFFNYNPQKEEIGIMFESTSKGSTYSVLCTPQKDENTGAFLLIEFSDGQEYSWLGEFVNSKLKKISSTNSYLDDLAQKYIKTSVSGIGLALIDLGFDVSISDLGMSAD